MSFHWSRPKTITLVLFLVAVAIGQALLILVWVLRGQIPATTWTFLLEAGTLIMNILLFLAAAAAALIYGLQLRTLIRQSEASLIVPLLRWYATPEMRAAVHAVWNEPREMFNKPETNPEKENQRRAVNLFWYICAVLVQRHIVPEDLVFGMFPRGNLAVWEKLRPLLEDTQMRILKTHHPDMPMEEMRRLAEERIGQTATAELYRRWLKRQQTHS